MLSLTGGMYLGWALGANDAANVFGTAVASRIISFRNASILCALSVLLGAAFQGSAGIETLSGLTTQSQVTLVVISVSAALTVTLMTVLRLPISTSQAIVGSIAGVAFATKDMNFGGLTKVLICWAATPVGAMLVCVVVYFFVWIILRFLPMSIFTRDKLLWNGLLIVGIYGSYALGANNVANATGIFSGQFENIGDRWLAVLGGVAIAVGVLTFSRRVMLAVGGGLMSLDAFTAFTAVLSMSITVHIFAFIGVPVSTSQAIVGAIIGIGLIRGARGFKFRVLKRMCVGWLLTPVLALLLAAAGFAIFS